MKVHGNPHRTIWLNDDGWSVGIIDQTVLPHRFETVTLKTLEDAADAISRMLVRGAPLIGATAAYGICLAVREEATSDDASLRFFFSCGFASLASPQITVLTALRPCLCPLHQVQLVERARRRLMVATKNNSSWLWSKKSLISPLRSSWYCFYCWR